MTLECAACGGAVDPGRDVRLRKDGFDIVRCPSCGLLFRARMPTDAELAAIYGPPYFAKAAGDTGGQGYADYLVEEDLHREAARRRLKELARLTPPGTLLDVGAAAGFFVDEACRAGWEARGIDVAVAMVDWGRMQLGARLDRGTIATADIPPASLRVVTMWDVIEHLTDPAADLRRAWALLDDRGILALSTGDAGSLAARVSGARWHLLTPRHHTYFFSVPTLHRLLARAGFEVVGATHPGGRYSLRYLSHKLRTVADVAPTRALTATLERSRAGGLAIPVNLWDIVTVYARKRAA